MNLTVHTNPAYEIIIEDGCISQIGKRTKKLLPKAERAVLVTDTHVGPLYADSVRQSLEAAGISVSVKSFPAGEPAEHCFFLYCFFKSGADPHGFRRGAWRRCLR